MNIQDKYWKYREESATAGLEVEKRYNDGCVKMLQMWAVLGKNPSKGYSVGEQGRITRYYNGMTIVTDAATSAIIGWSASFENYTESYSMEHQILLKEVCGLTVNHIGIAALYNIMKRMDEK